MKACTEIVHVSFADAVSKGPPPADNLAVPIFSHGSLVVEFYTPFDQDPQQPHTRDEVYFVARGKALFFDGARRHSVEAGSFLFVPAGHIHCFAEFSPDFAVWVAFYGPEGGEPDASRAIGHEPVHADALTPSSHSALNNGDPEVAPIETGEKTAVPDGFLCIGRFEPSDADRLIRRFETDGIRFQIDKVEIPVRTSGGSGRVAQIEIFVDQDDVEKANTMVREDLKL
jgi:Cupin domain